MGRDKAAGQTYLNYTVPKVYGDSNGFQAGSTFKAFVLASALEEGIDLNQNFPSPNGPITLNEVDYENCGDEPYGYGTFQMANSVQSGGTENLYTGTRKSINTFFLNLEAETGICKPYQLAKDMGVRLTCPNQGDCPGIEPERVPVFTLGVADVSPLEMAEAYATFGARGNHCESRPVASIEDANGRMLKEYTPRCTQVMSESTADAVNDVLRGVIMEPDGFAYGQNLGVPSAGKTGTTGTQGGISPSVWFVGYTPTVATASMIAGANEFGTPIGLDGLSVHGQPVSASGSGLAAPMWGDAMRGIDLEYVDFEAPTSVGGFGQDYVYVAPPSSSSSGGDRGRRGGRG
jgi:membrane peptidoglycan carboxypeptidase